MMNVYHFPKQHSTYVITNLYMLLESGQEETWSLSFLLWLLGAIGRHTRLKSGPERIEGSSPSEATNSLIKIFKRV